MRALLAVSALLLFACAEEPKKSSPVTPSPSSSAAAFVPPAEFKRLRISTTPHLNPERLKAQAEPMAAYLSRKLGVPVELVVAKSYDDLGQELARGEIDLGIFSPFSWVRAQKLDPTLQPVVMVIADGSPSSAGYIVVRADGPLRTLDDLKGKSIALVDPASTTGYLYPMKLMRDRGVDPKTFFSRTEFLGNHEAALLAVHDGRFDSAAIFQGALTELKAAKGIDPLEFRVIGKTARTPHNIYSARGGLDPTVLAELRRLFLGLSARTPEGRQILRPMQINGFIEVDDRLFDEVRQADLLVNGPPEQNR